MKMFAEERGMVLLIVLVLLTVLSSLMIDLGYTTMVDLRLTETFRDSTKAYYLAKGGIEAGRMVLENDGNGYDAPTEWWAQEIVNYPIKEGNVSIKIADLEGKLNLNGLVTNGVNPNTKARERAERLFATLGIQDEQALTAAITDWIDEDDSVYNNASASGAESAYYRSLPRPYESKNASLDTLEELLMVKGFDQDIIDLIAPHVTLYGDAKVNINTVTYEVLASWLPNITTQEVEDVITFRQDQPLKGKNDMGKIPSSVGWYSSMTSDIKFKSEFYRITTEGYVGEGGRRAEAVVKKGQKNPIYWKVL